MANLTVTDLSYTSPSLESLLAERDTLGDEMNEMDEMTCRKEEHMEFVWQTVENSTW